MDLIRTVDAMQARARERRCTGQRLALVPTMGALHDGHLALVRAALDAADHVTVSIFVNPTQFGPDEDFDAYPRTLEADCDTLDALGVDVVFAPSADEMYPHAGGHPDPSGAATQNGADAPESAPPTDSSTDASTDPLTDPLTWVTVDRLDETLCGAHREGHFRGVTTVVTKLLNACTPDVAVFGRKDAQQFVIVRRMVEELLLDVDIIGVPIVRESDGLALSSRNRYLSDAERAQATVLHDAVTAAEARIRGGEQRVSAVVRAMHDALAEAPDANVQYAAVVDAQTLQPLDTLTPGTEVLAAVAVFFGDTRLIDNSFVHVPTR